VISGRTILNQPDLASTESQPFIDSAIRTALPGPPVMPDLGIKGKKDRG